MRNKSPLPKQCPLLLPVSVNENENERSGKTSGLTNDTATGSSGSRVTASLPPRGFNRVTAAAYIGVSPCLFDQMVKDGRMPKPLRINTRVLWDRRLIDGAFDSLLSEEIPTQNPWDEETG